jgi:hypothetical protein
LGKNAISRKAQQQGWQKSGTSAGQEAGQTPEKGWAIKPNTSQTIRGRHQCGYEQKVAVHSLGLSRKAVATPALTTPFAGGAAGFRLDKVDLNLAVIGRKPVLNAWNNRLKPE